MIATSMEEARELLAKAQELEDLREHGFGRGSPLSEVRLEAIAASADWCKQQRATKGVALGYDSYFYKHQVERWFASRGDRTVYVPMGAFIAAAYGLGFKCSRTRGVNARFNFSRVTSQLGWGVSR